MLYHESGKLREQRLLPFIFLGLNGCAELCGDMHESLILLPALSRSAAQRAWSACCVTSERSHHFPLHLHRADNQRSTQTGSQMKPALAKGVPVLLASVPILTSRSPSKLRSILSKLSLLLDGEGPMVLPASTQCNYIVFPRMGDDSATSRRGFGDKLNICF